MFLICLVAIVCIFMLWNMWLHMNVKELREDHHLTCIRINLLEERVMQYLNVPNDGGSNE